MNSEVAASRLTPVSAVVVLYYSRHLVEGLVKNLRSTIPGLDEIVLVDNSREGLSDFVTNEVRLVEPAENLGYGSGVNAGVLAAKNEFILVVNPDVRVRSWGVEAALFLDKLFLLSGLPREWPEGIRTFPTLSGDFLRLALQNLAKPFGFLDKQAPKILFDNTQEFTEVDWVSGGMFLTNKKTLSAIGGFDEKYFLFYEELDLCQRAKRAGADVLITKGIDFDLNIGTSSAIDVSELKCRSEVRSAKRYHSSYSGYFRTVIVFATLKIYCAALLVGLKLAIVISSSKKIKAKYKQYYYYFCS